MTDQSADSDDEADARDEEPSDGQRDEQNQYGGGDTEVDPVDQTERVGEDASDEGERVEDDGADEGE